VKKSRVAMEPLWKVVAFPYAGLLLAAKALAVLGEVFFTRVLTPRVARELPEIPMAVYVVVAAATLLLNRCDFGKAVSWLVLGMVPNIT